MMTSTNNPRTMPSSKKESTARRPLQSLNVNSKGRTGVLTGDQKHPSQTQSKSTTMTVSTSARYPLAAAHNRKRRPAFPLQDKLIKTKSMLNFVTTVEIASSSSAEMSVNQPQTKVESSTMFEEQQTNSIFRERDLTCCESRDAVETEDEEDLWSLKRASPITEDDYDEEFMSFESPSKKSKGVESIYWESQLANDKPFDLSAMMGTR